MHDRQKQGRWPPPAYTRTNSFSGARVSHSRGFSWSLSRRPGPESGLIVVGRPLLVRADSNRSKMAALNSIYELSVRLRRTIQ